MFAKVKKENVMPALRRPGLEASFQIKHRAGLKKDSS
jgi:hypothetical protein